MLGSVRGERRFHVFLRMITPKDPNFIFRVASIGRNEFFFGNVSIMQVTTDDSSDSHPIPSTHIAIAQRVAFDVSASILQTTVMITTIATTICQMSAISSAATCKAVPISTAPTLFPALLLSVTVTTHCVPVVTVSTADAPQSATLGDLNMIGQPAWHLTQG